MAFVSMDQATTGMVLAAEVFDRRGRLLMQAGAELTDRHLTAFRMWGVDQVEIVGDSLEEEPQPTISPELLAEADALVDDLFAHAGPDHPLLAVLRDLSRARVAKRLAQAPRGSSR